MRVGTSMEEKFNVLIVDDLIENLKAMDYVLEDLDNINLVHAQSGEQALKCLLSSRFAVVLLDVNMPGMDGYEVANLIAKNPATKYLPVVMVTALGNNYEAILKAYQAGAVDFLVKPIQPEILLNKVKQFVELFSANEKAARSLLKLADLRKETETILNTAGEGVLKVDLKGKITYVNKKTLDILKTNPAKLLGAQFDGWFRDKTYPQFFSHLIEQSKQQSDCLRVRFDSHTAGGDVIPVEALCSYTSGTNSSDDSLIVLFQDITERISMENQLLRMANYDPLTGLANRAFFHNGLTRALSRSNRMGGLVGLMMLDLDKFKQVNDNLGHDVGDALLKAVSKRLSLCLRDCDTVARLGGDEFAVILEDLDGNIVDQLIESESKGRLLAQLFEQRKTSDKGKINGEMLAARIVEQLATPYDLVIDGTQAHHLVVESSIGIAFSRGEELTINELVKAADVALYQAKDAGRNTYRVFAAQMSLAMQEQENIEKGLASAIEKTDSLVMMYQPLLCLNSQKVVGLEGLLRWRPEDLQQAQVLPTEFIPIAEKSRLIHQIGEVVFSKVFKQLELWRSYFEQRNLTLSVNLSTKQLTSPDFLKMFDQLVEPFEINCQQLVFEISEDAISINDNEAYTNLCGLKERGFGLSLDNFGKSRASLTCLQRLQLDIIKLDLSLVRSLEPNSKHYPLAKSIIAAAKSLNITVVAEGVETAQELKTLLALECDLAQGYYFCQEIDAESIASEKLDELENQLKVAVNK
jgi:diguanylate cyclase (GGDEF)-like protein/PAS domain S-box-containing protein